MPLAWQTETARRHLSTAAWVCNQGNSGTADAVWCWNHKYLALPAVLLVLFGWMASLFQPGPLRWTLGAITIGYIASMLVYSLFVLPAARYQALGMAIVAFAAGAGAYSVAAGLGRVLSLHWQ